MQREHTRDGHKPPGVAWPTHGGVIEWEHAYKHHGGNSLAFGQYNVA